MKQNDRGLCKKVCLLVFFCFSLSGCATLQYTPVNDLGKGPSKVYNYSYIAVYDAALGVMNDRNINIQSKDRKFGWIMGVEKPGLISSGQHVSIYVQSMSEKVTRVEVLTKRVVATEVYVGDVSQKIFDDISKKLESGKPS